MSSEVFLKSGVTLRIFSNSLFCVILCSLHTPVPKISATTEATPDSPNIALISVLVVVVIVILVFVILILAAWRRRRSAKRQLATLFQKNPANQLECPTIVISNDSSITGENQFNDDHRSESSFTSNRTRISVVEGYPLNLRHLNRSSPAEEACSMTSNPIYNGVVTPGLYEVDGQDPFCDEANAEEDVEYSCIPHTNEGYDSHREEHHDEANHAPFRVAFITRGMISNVAHNTANTSMSLNSNLPLLTLPTTSADNAQPQNASTISCRTANEVFGMVSHDSSSDSAHTVLSLSAEHANHVHALPSPATEAACKESSNLIYDGVDTPTLHEREDDDLSYDEADEIEQYSCMPPINEASGSHGVERHNTASNTEQPLGSITAGMNSNMDPGTVNNGTHLNSNPPVPSLSTNWADNAPLEDASITNYMTANAAYGIAGYDSSSDSTDAAPSLSSEEAYQVHPVPSLPAEEADQMTNNPLYDGVNPPRLQEIEDQDLSYDEADEDEEYSYIPSSDEAPHSHREEHHYEVDTDEAPHPHREEHHYEVTH